MDKTKSKLVLFILLVILLIIYNCLRNNNRLEKFYGEHHNHGGMKNHNHNSDDCSQHKNGDMCTLQPKCHWDSLKEVCVLMSDYRAPPPPISSY